MYQTPTYFPAVSTRETWTQVIQLADGDTGDLIELKDDSGHPAYSFALEIIEAAPVANRTGYGSFPWGLDDCTTPIITASLDDGRIMIVDTGTISIVIPKTAMQSLLPRTYDVYLTITSVDDTKDGRQLLIGKLPVLYGGRNT